MNADVDSQALIRAVSLGKTFTGRGGTTRAVHGVSLKLAPGSTLGIVGESGSGKSTLARLLLRLIEPTDGGLYYEGVDALSLRGEDLRRRRRRMQMVFQNPYGSLLPGYTVLANVMEPLRLHDIGTKDYRRERAREVLDLVGLNLTHGRESDYPRQFSGGQQQRIAIARALATEPDLLVCDEPTSALDVSIQAQILALLQRLRKQLGFAMVFISHNLAVIERMADDVMVMKNGIVVESGPCRQLFANPQQTYTAMLLEAVLPVH